MRPIHGARFDMPVVCMNNSRWRPTAGDGSRHRNVANVLQRMSAIGREQSGARSDNRGRAARTGIPVEETGSLIVPSVFAVLAIKATRFPVFQFLPSSQISVA